MICIGPLVFHLPPKRLRPRGAVRRLGTQECGRRTLRTGIVDARDGGGEWKRCARARARRRWWRREDLETEGFSGGRAEGRRCSGEGRRAAAARGGSSRAASREWAPAGPEWVYTSMELRLRHNRASTSFPYPSIIHADLSPSTLSVLSREPTHLLAPIAERRAPFLEEFLFSWSFTLFLPSSSIPRLFFIAVDCVLLFRFGVSVRRGPNHRRFMRENSFVKDTASVPLAIPLCPSTGLLFRWPFPIFPLLSYSLNL